MEYWLSTKSPRRMFCASYCTPKLDKLLAESMGVDPAILAEAIGLSAPSIRAYQRSLGIRKCASHMDYREKLKMLNNTAWDKPKITPQESIFSNARLVAWLEKKPRDGTYDYTSGCSCLIAQYLGEMGMDVSVGATTYNCGFAYHPLPANWNYVAATNDWTYGAALERARCVFGLPA